MIFTVGAVTVRPPEPSDLEALYTYKNSPELGEQLLGFTTGYSRADLTRWIEFHAQREDEALWVIADAEDRCVGHVGLYEIDFRVGTAELGILIGNHSFQGRGLGRSCMAFAVDYAFEQLNLNRVSARVLATNGRSVHVLRTLGFREEGRLRRAQFKNGRFIDVMTMGVLREERAAVLESVSEDTVGSGDADKRVLSPTSSPSSS